jgi:hypothetical protein
VPEYQALQEVLAQTEVAKALVGALRETVMKVAARVLWRCRGVRMQLPSSSLARRVADDAVRSGPDWAINPSLARKGRGALGRSEMRPRVRTPGHGREAPD